MVKGIIRSILNFSYLTHTTAFCINEDLCIMLCCVLKNKRINNPTEARLWFIISPSANLFLSFTTSLQFVFGSSIEWMSFSYLKIVSTNFKVCVIHFITKYYGQQEIRTRRWEPVSCQLFGIFMNINNLLLYTNYLFN